MHATFFLSAGYKLQNGLASSVCPAPNFIRAKYRGPFETRFRMKSPRMSARRLGLVYTIVTTFLKARYRFFREKAAKSLPELSSLATPRFPASFRTPGHQRECYRTWSTTSFVNTFLLQLAPSTFQGEVLRCAEDNPA